MKRSWGSSDEDDDDLLYRAMEEWERTGQIGGGAANNDPLFKFKMLPIGKRRQWRNVVERQNFNAQLNQLREPVAADNIGHALTEALYNAIEMELIKQERPAHHFVNMAITANGFQHAYQSANFTVGEFLQRTARLDEMLSKLSGKLNSNQSFNPSEGFSVDVVFVKMPGKGKGRQKNNAGQRCLEKENKRKNVLCYKQ